MGNLASCPECGVPEYVTSEHVWLNNGDIVQRKDEGARIIFFESENVDPLIKNIEEIIGVSIEHIITTSVRRAVRHYVSLIVPDEAKEQIRKYELDPIPIAHAMIDVARLMGRGGQEFVDYRYQQDNDDYYTVKMLEPFSVPMVCGTIVGAVEAVLGGDRSFTCERESQDVYRVTVFPSPHVEELRQRMWVKPYRHREGDTELERCATCGGPKALSGYQWFFDRGIIINRTTRRRMVLLGPSELDQILNELEAELGETIPQVVVEAQRRFTRSGFYTIDDVSSEGDFRTLLALRGLGNMKEIEMSKKGLRMRLENAAIAPMIVGMVQGVFEMALSLDSTVEWELSEDGNLEVEVIPVSK